MPFQWDNARLLSRRGKPIELPNREDDGLTGETQGPGGSSAAAVTPFVVDRESTLRRALHTFVDSIKGAKEFNESEHRARWAILNELEAQRAENSEPSTFTLTDASRFRLDKWLAELCHRVLGEHVVSVMDAWKKGVRKPDDAIKA